MKQIKHASGREFLAVVLALALAGCATPEASPTPTAAPSATAVPSATVVPTVTSTPFIPKASLKVVIQSPANTGISFGVQLAVDQLDQPLNLLGYDVDFEAYDDQFDVDLSVKHAREIIADPEVLCVVGPYLSRAALNVMDLYHPAGLAFISPSASNPSVTARRLLEVNRVGARDDGVGIAAARFVQAQGLETAFLVKNVDDYGSRTADAFKREANALGIKVSGDMASNTQMGNYEAVAARVVEAAPAVVYYAGTADQAGAFFKQVRLAGYMGMLLAADATPALGEQAGPLATDGGGTYYVSEAAPIRVLKGAGQFVLEFQSSFGQPPEPYAAEAYDAAGMCLKAVEAAVNAKAGELPTRQEVAQALRALKDYPGVTGTINLDAAGDRSPAPYFVLQVKSIDPQNWAMNPLVETLELPPPK